MESTSKNLILSILLLPAVLCSLLFLGIVCSFVQSTPVDLDTTESSSNTAESTDTPTSKEIESQIVKVTQVVDGDTIQVEIDGKSEKVRLIGVDTPETVDPRRAVECYGKEASAKLKELIANSDNEVRLVSDSTQGDSDRYNRLLRYVILKDGTDVGITLIGEGYAHEYTYSKPYMSQAVYKQAQKDAQTNNLGLWNANNCSTTTESTSPTPTQVISPSVSNSPAPTTTIQATPEAVTPSPTMSKEKYSCNCAKSCKQIASCDEAYYQLNTCGCSARDGDGDGVPCDSLC